MKKLKILMLTRFYQNGQSTHVFSLCQSLIAQGHSPFLVASYLGHPSYITWLQRNNIPFTNIANLDKLAYRLKNKKFDIIHTHSAHTLETALSLGNAWNIPVIGTCHYFDFSPIEKLALADKVIVISEEMFNTLPIDKNKMAVIENGVNTQIFKPGIKNPRNPRIILLARIDSTKEDNFIYLARTLKEKGYHLRSVGNWRPPIKIPFSLWTSDVAPYLSNSDIVVGTGRAIIEGMAAGCGAFILGEHCDGLVTPENIDIFKKYNFMGRATNNKLSQDAINQILQLTDKQLNNLQEFGRKYACQHFSIEEVIKKTIAVYREKLE